MSFCAARVIASPPEAVAAAVAHARVLPPDSKRRPRYLDLTNFSADERQDWIRLISYHLNALSREPDITLPLVINDKLLYFDLRDYAIDPTVYGRLAAIDPYFHVRLEGDQKDQYGRVTKVRAHAAAPWLPHDEMVELVNLCQSQTPILRADWFYYQTAVSAERAAGYYDFLGLGKKADDFYKMVGAIPTEAKRLKLEAAASIQVSTVAIHNRGITRLQALTGGLWLTADFKTSVDRQNTIRVLKGDTEPPEGDFSEVFGVLPNKLFAYWLQDSGGNRADTAPDFIASDRTATSPDRRVHAGLSCMRCHVEGLRPLDDYARKLYRGNLELRSPEYDRLKRLRQLYLSDLPSQLAADNATFASAVKACNGLSVAENAALVSRAWEFYADTPVPLSQAARELGCLERNLLSAVLEYVRHGGVVDPVMAAYAQTPAIAITRQHFEESFPQFQKILGKVP
jgi:hypothetical protein